MLVLSIDVGIKNLAMCIFDNGHLRKWEILNIALPKAEEIVKGPSCSGIALCRKKVAFKRKASFFCTFAETRAKMSGCSDSLTRKSGKLIMNCKTRKTTT